MFKKHLIITFGILLSLTALAQQESQYTQFMHNKVLFNPAYAGFEGAPVITLLHRQQWMGFEKAPQSQVLSVHAPFFVENVGWGLSVSRQSAGVLNRWNVSLPYSYTLTLGDDHHLRMGVQGSLRYFGLDFGDPSVVATDANDPVIAEGMQGKFMGNAGAGLFWNLNRTYAGVSVPHLFATDIDFSGEPREIVSRQSAHLYFMAGTAFPVSSSISLMPNVMVKTTQGAPIGFDINLNADFYERFMAGLSYRSGGAAMAESVDILFFYRITDAFSLGAAYDFSVGPLSSYNNGSFEIMLQFLLGGRAAETPENGNGSPAPRVF